MKWEGPLESGKSFSFLSNIRPQRSTSGMYTSGYGELEGMVTGKSKREVKHNADFRDERSKGGMK
jgi:hypothetical protein